MGGKCSFSGAVISACQVHVCCLDCSYVDANLGLMDDLRFRLNFNLSEKNEIYHHS